MSNSSTKKTAIEQITSPNFISDIKQAIVANVSDRIFNSTIREDNPQPRMKTTKKVSKKTTKKTSAKKTTNKRIKKTMAKTRAVNITSTKKHLIAIADDGNARSINDFLTALQATEWKTESAKPYSVVAACLANNKKTFRQVSKGSYALIKE